MFLPFSINVSRNDIHLLVYYLQYLHHHHHHVTSICNFWKSILQSIPWLDLQTLFASIPLHSMIIEYSMLTLFVCLFQTPYHHSLVIDLGSNHRLTRFHHFITTLIGLAGMFQSFAWSMLRMRNAKCGEMKGLNWNSRAWFDMRNRNVVFCKFNRFWIIK